MLRIATIAFSVLMITRLSYAEIVIKQIDYKAGDTQMTGYLAYDDSTTDKRPGVAIVHEWWGNNDYPKTHPATRQARICRFRHRHVRQRQAHRRSQGGRRMGGGG